ncbi:peroxidase 43 [Momordica charantia]|uniref:Peroxidase n=1 Tax=Momordica charantia TaxID=3673 RepID=A0A6J1DLM4_MOMCH|nr:peroxidase 43 [Momordica charantia]
MAKFLMPLSLLLLLMSFAAMSEGQLGFGFYSQTCPSAESIVRSVVSDAVRASANAAAVLLRLHFHDCYVDGCDGSILIDNGPRSEKLAFGHQGVGGFEIIERAKQAVEAECPGVVSCADIVAMAARDAIVLANGPEYEVETGRRDGRVSEISHADDLPDVGDSVQVLKDKFAQKGMTDKDLVLLSAAHTIGTTACFFMTKRLYNFSPGGSGSDPDISPALLPELKSQCPPNGDVSTRLAIDRGSQQSFDIHILQNIRNGFAVLASDARLNDDASTRAVMDSYFSPLTPIFGPSFQDDFVNSMVRMGQIGVKSGSQGEIRRVCSSFNSR